ncbi:SDR family oxidoreductase [Pokkaliibacter sp. CJK22405]|uniref:SDR family oxidoreductase n=1 Tax=Pokkaliibacter sp. CJK22405 TaxID=3384615 RepID=UPI0039854A0E
MKVFVTGATGFIGSLVVTELRQRGHEVMGLARSDTSAAALRQQGVEVVYGSLEDTEILATAARACDGVIHTAFIHDFSNFAHSVAVDRAAVQAMGEALKGSHKPFVIASGTAMLSYQGRPALESDRMKAEDFPRAPTELYLLDLAEQGVRSSSVRLPPSVHDATAHGFIPSLIEIARKRGVAGYIGSGENCWPAVHRKDAAKVFCLALEKGQPGTAYHAVADEGIPTKELASLMGAHLSLPVVSVPAEKAAEHFDWLGHFFAMHNPASSAFTRETLGWEPVEYSLRNGLTRDDYYPEKGTLALSD